MVTNTSLMFKELNNDAQIKSNHKSHNEPNKEYRTIKTAGTEKLYIFFFLSVILLKLKLVKLS